MCYNLDVVTKERKRPYWGFFPDSPEQIEESMKRLGPLRHELDEAFQEAIARVNKGRQEPSQPATRGTVEIDTVDGTPLKQGEQRVL